MYFMITIVGAYYHLLQLTFFEGSLCVRHSAKPSTWTTLPQIHVRQREEMSTRPSSPGCLHGQGGCSHPYAHKEHSQPFFLPTPCSSLREEGPV